MTSPQSAPCTAYQDLFDANGLTTKRYENAGDEDKLQELRRLAQTVDDTAEALTACSHCPLLEACREQVARNIEEAAPPCGVVQAGIYWGADSQPDFTLNGCLSRKSALAAQKESQHCPRKATRTDENGNEWPLTVSVYATISKNPCEANLPDGPICYELEPWDTSWVPAIPEPINTLAVEMVCSEGGMERAGIPQTRVERKNAVKPDKQEVLTDSEVCEIVRRLSKRGETIRFMCSKLNIHSHTMKRLLSRLGLPIKYSKFHPLRVIAHERTRVEKRIFDQQQREKLVAATKQSWDSAEVGQQLALCAATFESELASK